MMALAFIFSICGLGQKFCINIFMILFYFSYQHPVCLKKDSLMFILFFPSEDPKALYLYYF